ncbi:hypothetical protein [Klebsiella pneumoniae IS53]|nr:hypothetical protein [Klebsiella pneumoniae IS53]
MTQMASALFSSASLMAGRVFSGAIAGAAAVGYQLWSGPGAGGGQQAKRGKYFLHDYIFLIYLLTQ